MDFSTNDTTGEDKWIIEMVEKGFVGEYTSHVLESSDKVHIAYYDNVTGDLKHAENGPDGWIIERVDQQGTVGQFLSTARADGGRIYICYRDQGKDRLKMAVFDGGRWNIEVVDNESFASFDTSIFVDDQGKVYISYYNLSKGYLKLAIKDKDRWKLEVVDDGQMQSNAVGGFSSLKVDARGRIHISYIDSVNGLLKYALKENDAWHIEVADDCEFVGNFTSLALDEEGNPYISYTVDKRPNKPDLWLAKKIGGKWITELVDTAEVAGNYSSIAVDQYSNIYISYSAMRALKVATNIQGPWNFEVVDTKGTVTYTSLSIDTDGMPHIAYHDQDRGVKYARKIRGT
ncbi:MAG: hypothetical protein RBS57_00125 [Desulforhabdus sp.]|jgi:frataxin-like iron-binding protein CyaY|nr:hypothetical protein [Desulforhabdus sp.]